MYEVFEHGSEDTKSRLEIITRALLSVKGIQKCLEKLRGQTVMLIIGMLLLQDLPQFQK